MMEQLIQVSLAIILEDAWDQPVEFVLLGVDEASMVRLYSGAGGKFGDIAVLWGQFGDSAGPAEASPQQLVRNLKIDPESIVELGLKWENEETALRLDAASRYGIVGSCLFYPKGKGWTADVERSSERIRRFCSALVEVLSPATVFVSGQDLVVNVDSISGTASLMYGPSPS